MARYLRYLVCFETAAHCLGQAGFELMMLSSQPPQDWVYRALVIQKVPPSLARIITFYSKSQLNEKIEGSYPHFTLILGASERLLKGKLKKVGIEVCK